MGPRHVVSAASGDLLELQIVRPHMQIPEAELGVGPNNFLFTKSSVGLRAKVGSSAGLSAKSAV